MEFWIPVARFEFADFYEVSSLGRVRRIKTYGGRPKCQVLRPAITKFGYEMVVLCVNGVPLSIAVHRLVAEAFVEGDHSLDINHKDGVKTRNLAANLEWVTKRENNAHSWRLGLSRAHGRGSGKRKLDGSKAEEIRNRRAKESVTDLAHAYGVCRQTIREVVAGRIWRAA